MLNTGFLVNETSTNTEIDPLNKHHRFTMLNSMGNLHILEESDVERDIGIHLSNRLNWDNQTNIMKASAYAELSKLKRNFQFWNVKTFKTLYCTYIRPKLEYCSSVWNP